MQLTNEHGTPSGVLVCPGCNAWQVDVAPIDFEVLDRLLHAVFERLFDGTDFDSNDVGFGASFEAVMRLSESDRYHAHHAVEELLRDHLTECDPLRRLVLASQN